MVDLSFNLGVTDGGREWFIGTRYSFGDTYQVLIDRGVLTERRYPATDDGTIDGKPVFLTEEAWEKLKKKSSLFTIATQQLQNPKAGGKKGFDDDWWRLYEIRPYTINVYILVDPARTRKKTSDRTAIAVVGMDANFNRFVLDGLCHRLTLSGRWNAIKYFRKKWLRAPGVQVLKVGYEKYGAEADLDYFEERMRDENKIARGAYFEIQELTWKRDSVDSHIDRVQRLEPHLRNARLWFPYPTDPQNLTSLQISTRNTGREYLLSKPIERRNEDNKIYDLMDWVKRNEYSFFPNVHVDWLDALSRMEDIEMLPPILRTADDLSPPAEAAY